jgi:WD40 repeat protein
MVIKKLIGHSGFVSSVTFSLDGSLLATCGKDKLINIYETNDFSLKAVGSAHLDCVRDIVFNKDASRLFSCADDGQVICWKIESNYLYVLNSYIQGTSWVLSLDIDDDNKTIASGNLNGKILLYNYQLGNYKMRLNYPVTNVLFKPNEPVWLKIAVATNGGGVYFIDAKDMKFKWN